MLKTGFSRLDVTPPLGSFVAGDFSARYSKAVYDPIYLNAVAISNEENTVIIISADFLQMRMKYADPIREKIAQRVNTSVENIMICCLHQHTSIVLKDGEHNNVVKDRAYMDMLERKFCDVAELAVNDMKEATVSTAIRETDEQIAFIRRYVMKNGAIETNPIGRYKEVERPYCEADNNVRLVKFCRKNANDIALVNFPTHADVIHQHVNSADWPGFVRSYIEKDLDGVSCIVTVGFQGDSNHCDFTIPQYKDGYEHSRHMGRVIADTVIKMWDKTKSCEVDKINANYDIVFNKTRTDDEEKYEEYKKIREDHYAGRIQGTDYTLLGKCTRVVNLRNAPIYQKIPVTVINLGNIGFVGLGGEPFTKYGVDIRAAFPDRFIITSCCTNGGEGYLPTKKAFSEGGYEAGASPFSPNLEEDCVNKAVELLNK